MISIIIINYNVKEHLKLCLMSIMECPQYEAYEVIVVDNYSFDNSAHIIPSEFPFVNFISLPANVGYAKAVNIGIKYSTGEHICLLNPDTIVRKQTFDILSEALKSEANADIVGCKVLNADGTFQLSSRRKFPSFWISFCKFIGLSSLFPKSKLFGQYNYTFQTIDSVQEVDAVNGACIMFKRNVFDTLHGFDERFFLYFEDTDFCFRAKQNNFIVKYIPTTSIVHYKGESHVHAPFDIKQVFLKSMRTFYRKHKGEFLFWKLINILLPIVSIFSRINKTLSSRIEKIVSFSIDVVFLSAVFYTSLLMWFYYAYDKTPSVELLLNNNYLLYNLIISWIIASRITKLYVKNYLSYARSVVATIIMFLLSSTSTYFLSFFAYSRAVLLFSSIGILFLTSSWRLLFHYFSQQKRISLFDNSIFTRRAVVLGSGVESIKIGSSLQNSPYGDFTLIGYVSDEWLDTENVIGLGRISELKGIVEHHYINEIIIPENIIPFEDIIHILENISNKNITLKIAPRGKDALIGKGIFENISGISLLDMEIPILDNFNILAKRIFDISLALLLIIFTSPILIISAIKNGLIKNNIWNIDNKILPIYQIDSNNQLIRKLPYLFHIFQGDLTFVGSQIVDISYNNPNILIKPGLTGLAQIKHTQKTAKEYALFDHYYMQNQSFMFDIEILFKSILKI